MGKENSLSGIKDDIKEVKKLMAEYVKNLGTYQISNQSELLNQFVNELNKGEYAKTQNWLLTGMIVVIVLLAVQIFSLFMLAE